MKSFVAVSFVALFTALSISDVPTRIFGWRLVTDVTKYEKAEKIPTPLPSRRWMNLALEVQMKENMAPATTARFYAYVASVYADVLSATEDNKQASRATAEIINNLTPKHVEATNDLLVELGTNYIYLNNGAWHILRQYLNRSRSDRADLVWDRQTPQEPHAWYIRDIYTPIDEGAMAGKWKPWILPEDREFSVPPPPTIGSFADRLELEKIRYATRKRTDRDIPTIRVWQGASGFVKEKSGDNINPAGVWQNILFVEVGTDPTMDDARYSQAQKLLAQAIADAFIVGWRVKYTYWTQRPSMRDPYLVLAIADPPFPGYVSGHSTISATAATILAHLFPNKRDVWEQNSQDAKNSRLWAGIHYDIDNQIGEHLGQRVGQQVLAKLYPDSYVLPAQYHKISRKEPAIETLRKFLILKAANALLSFRFDY